MRLATAIARGSRLVAARITGALVPFHVVLYVTARCNLRCVYCSFPREESELTADEWCRVLDDCRSVGTERVQFFGGEPLLRTDLGQMVQHAKRLGLTTVLNTNGVLVPYRRDVVKHVDTVVVSLDGRQAAHDANRGAGSFRQAARAIQAARSWGVPVKVNAVMNDANAADLEWLVTFTAQERVPLTVNVMRSESNGLWRDAEDHRPADDAVRALVRRVIALKRRYAHLVFSAATLEFVARWPDFSLDRLRDEDASRAPGAPACSAGRFHCVIYADGRLYPCTITARLLPALDVRAVGVARALEAASRHGCASCSSACMVEMNSLFALRPRVVAGLARAYLFSEME